MPRIHLQPAERWDTWYPKAWAAYQQVKPEMSDDEIIEIYEDVGPMPPRAFFDAEELGEIAASDVEKHRAFFVECVRLFKQEFGDGPGFLAVLSGRQHQPFFLLTNYHLNAKTTDAVVCTPKRYDIGPKVTYRRGANYVSFRRGGVWEFIKEQIPHSAAEWAIAIPVSLFGLLVGVVALVAAWFISIPALIGFSIWYFAKKRRNEATAPGWGWKKDTTLSVILSREGVAPEWRQFLESTNRKTNDIMNNAFRGKGFVVRGSQISTSVETAQGTPPSG